MPRKPQPVAASPRPLFTPKFTEIVASEFGVPAEDVTPDTTLVDDLGADSLDLVEFAMTLETAYRIEIPDSVVESWECDETGRDVTLADVADMLKKRGVEVRAGAAA